MRTPAGIQKFLDRLPYHPADTAWSPRRVLREETAHCLEGAVFAAAALRVLGFPPLVMDLEAIQDSDHVIAPFRVRGHWGALAASHFVGLRYREPIYRTLREMVMSYFDDYYNLRGERTLRRYSRPASLARFDHLNWMTTEKNVWFITDLLVKLPHRPILSKTQIRGLSRLDARAKESGLYGHRVKK